MYTPLWWKTSDEYGSFSPQRENYNTNSKIMTFFASLPSTRSLAAAKGSSDSAVHTLSVLPAIKY